MCTFDNLGYNFCVHLTVMYVCLRVKTTYNARYIRDLYNFDYRHTADLMLCYSLQSGPALGTLQAKLPPATPVTTCTPVSSALTSRSQPPMITPSRPPPKTFEKTTKSNGDGTEVSVCVRIHVTVCEYVHV